MLPSTLVRHLGITLVAAVLLLALTYVLDPFRDYQLATAAGYLCAAAGLTVLTGLNGQLSLGHGALMAIGAYTVALVQNQFGGEQCQYTVDVAVVARGRGGCCVARSARSSGWRRPGCAARTWPA